MKVITATEYTEKQRQYFGVLWASAVATEQEKINLIANDILRLLVEMENPSGINLNFENDNYGEAILKVKYGEDSVIEYKCMDGAHEA